MTIFHRLQGSSVMYFNFFTFLIKNLISTLMMLQTVILQTFIQI